ncbi:hypothetical protein [Streptomyces chartreusis]
MNDPVFVIHGVANRDRQGFTAMVADLQTASGHGMVPVYWGDLGADDTFVAAALPASPAAYSDARKGSGLRDADDPPAIAVPEPVLASALVSGPEVPNQWPHVETAIRERLANQEQQSNAEPRNRPDYGDAEEILELLAEE